MVDGELPMELPVVLPVGADAEIAYVLHLERHDACHGEWIAAEILSLAHDARAEVQLGGGCPARAERNAANHYACGVEVDQRLRLLVSLEPEGRFRRHQPIERGAPGGAVEVPRQQLGVVALGPPHHAAETEERAEVA